MRKHLTPAEAKIWTIVRRSQLGHRFRRQYRIGVYIVDFVCIEKKLVVELDGAQHEDNLDDRERDRFLASKGLRVLRLWNEQVINGEWAEGVIRAWLDDPSLGVDGEPWVYD